ncbi:NUDIX hydrolase [Brevundimonas subvibrioides]|uniref:NUDIX hydrolase n=1 Tax=Brevundimonas subvibrioides (strain ATCC 15264 / DSM 4735 / LMG 14903 / NBRC 16000 / CB 81) TaxID=633149 RepID=D9QGU5_BRESC|nr:NUDIX hydrolase [Brevundimonas subvibrioides]ADL00911.1 NUDIX hydrolase [Brevundimonas subvibrioides ATCC 15264]
MPSAHQPFDAAQDLADAPRAPGPRQRPKDAATLILVRSGRHPQVLMGRRAPGHVFMASKWVFPGGRIDRSDFSAASATEPSAATRARLETELAPHRARALCLTAVRETFEETGLILGRPAPPASVAGPWREFRAAGALADLAALDYVARAITPPGRTRRFDARFFMADAAALLAPEPTAGSGELDEIAWLPLEAARALDLPSITRFVLTEVAERLTHKGRPIPFVRMVRGTHQVTHD